MTALEQQSRPGGGPGAARSAVAARKAQSSRARHDLHQTPAPVDGGLAMLHGPLMDPDSPPRSGESTASRPPHPGGPTSIPDPSRSTPTGCAAWPACTPRVTDSAGRCADELGSVRPRGRDDRRDRGRTGPAMDGTPAPRKHSRIRPCPPRLAVGSARHRPAALPRHGSRERDLASLIGGRASLNLFVALVGASGAGKGAAMRAAAEAVTIIQPFPVMPLGPGKVS